MNKSLFGQTHSGEEVFEYTLSNRHGSIVKFINYGAAITQVHVPDKQGQITDITLGFPSLADYLENAPSFGVIAGRYANRIAKGQFQLHGTNYQLSINDGPNHLHGGTNGFKRQLFKEVEEASSGESVRLAYISREGEEGYPGELSLELEYALTDENELVFRYKASTTRATPINLTNHAYWNLAGENGGTIHDHLLQIHADHYTPVGPTLIPTGELDKVADSPLDFRNRRRIGDQIDQAGSNPTGYDHNFILNKSSSSALELAASVTHPGTGRRMDVLTTEPAIQLYTGNFLDGTLKGKTGRPYGRQEGFCLECQHYPDSPNQPQFPSTILEPGDLYEQTTIHRFSIEE